jgi:hypothetical protein
MVFLEFLSVFGLLEVFMNFWLKNCEVSWRNEDFGIFYENGDFGNSKFRPPLPMSCWVLIEGVTWSPRVQKLG